MDDKQIFPTLGPIVIGTADIKKSKDFYVSVFGIVVENEEANYISARGADGTHIEIEEDSKQRFPNWAKHNIGTYKNSEFIVEDIHTFLENVEKHGGRTVSEPVTRPWGGAGAEFSDPDGNIFLIAQK